MVREGYEEWKGKGVGVGEEEGKGGGQAQGKGQRGHRTYRPAFSGHKIPSRYPTRDVYVFVLMKWT